MAPEYATVKSYDSQADMFSLGMLIYCLYNHGKTFYHCNDNYSTFVKMSDDLKSLNTTKLSVLPMEVREHVKMLLSVRPELRPDAGQFSKVLYKKKTMFIKLIDRIGVFRSHFSKMLEQKLWNILIHYFKSIIFKDQCSTKVFLKFLINYQW